MKKILIATTLIAFGSWYWITYDSGVSKNNSLSSAKEENAAKGERASSPSFAHSQETVKKDSSEKEVASLEKIENKDIKLFHYRHPDSDLFADKQVIYKKYPYLEVSDKNINRVLFNGEHWKKTNATLTSSENIDAVFEGLQEQYSNLTEENFTLVNIMRVDFVRQALRLNDNPQADYIEEKIVAFLNRFPSPQEKSQLSDKAQSEMLGDKLDLIYAMQMYEHEKYRQLKERASAKLAKLIAYAESHKDYHKRFSN